jgi:hypothetical protein
VFKRTKLLIQINGKMKNSGKIAGILLMLLIACNLSLSAQHGMRAMRPDSVGMGRMRMDQRQMPMMNQNHDFFRMGGMHYGMGPMQMNIRSGFRQQAPGMRSMENIPNLTDKQKKDIADLNGKQMAEMEKLRIDMQSKMKDLREAHKAKVMSILTAEQKKWVEENTPGPAEK